MFYFFHGTDTEKVRARMHAVLEGAKKKKGDAEVFKMTAENLEGGDLDLHIGGMGLFEKKSVVIMDRVFENELFAAEILSKIKEIAETENLFLFVEGKLDKKTLEKIEKHAFKSERFDAQQVVKKEFNVFALSDALARRDKKNLWVLYRKFIDDEIAPEALSGTLFWKLKTMILSPNQNYKAEELKKLSSDLVSIYHDSHRGIHEFEVGLERWVLGV